MYIHTMKKTTETANEGRLRHGAVSQQRLTQKQSVILSKIYIPPCTYGNNVYPHTNIYMYTSSKTYFVLF